MKKGFLLGFSLLVSRCVWAQNEIGPEGNKLLWLLPVLVVIILVVLISSNTGREKNKSSKKTVFAFRKISVELEKDALYYPDNLKLTVTNKGNADVDLDKPLLIFDNFWLKRKFRIKGTGRYQFYPLYLAKGETHSINIELDRFYGHDKKLKRFPKVKVEVYDVNGKKLGSRSVFLRKTLFKY